MTDPLFAVCTFQRVFDTEPIQELVSLEELSRALMTFEVKLQLGSKVERDLARIDSFWARWQAGQLEEGKRTSPILAAARQARADHKDPDEAVRLYCEELRVDVGRNAKKDLRIWSPTLYKEDAPKRGSDHVEHLSCLVLDYDSGVPLDDALEAWSRWFHLVHTTWSHTPEQPKYRVILPLAAPVRAEDWPNFWQWAFARTGGVVDSAPKSAGSTFALPAIPRPQWVHRSFKVSGPLLDPVAEGVVSCAATAPAARTALVISPFVHDPDCRYLEENPVVEEEKPLFIMDALDEDEIWSGGAFGSALDTAPHNVMPVDEILADDPVEAPPGSMLEAALLERLEMLLARLEALEAKWTLGTLADSLERLVTLRNQGDLTQEEFEQSKALILAG